MDVRKTEYDMKAGGGEMIQFRGKLLENRPPHLIVANQPILTTLLTIVYDSNAVDKNRHYDPSNIIIPIEVCPRLKSIFE